MNMKDICILTPKNLDSDFLFYHRAKTIRTKKKDLRPIKVYLNEQAMKIIERRRLKDPDAQFLFPMVADQLTPRQLEERIHGFIKFVNAHMDEIRKDLGISQPLTTYAARHSFATVLKNKGVSPMFIKESLGHSSFTTTENYLSDFTDEVKKEYGNLLTSL